MVALQRPKVIQAGLKSRHEDELANEFRNDLHFLMPRTARNIQRSEHERFALDQG